MRHALLPLCLALYMPLAAHAQDTGITVPDEFKAEVFADDLGFARHIAARPYGEDGQDLYIALRRQKDGHGIVALRDRDGDGVVDEKASFGDLQGTGIEIAHGHLYFGTNLEVLRIPLGDDLVPQGAFEVIATGFPEQRQHAAKTLAFDGSGGMYVNVGAPSNACQERARTKGSRGLSPCPQLDQQAGIWKFDAEKPGQDQKQAARYATGIRNAVALAWDKHSDALYFAQHGRDQLSQLFPDLYNDRDNAENPAEEVHRASNGSDHGWPYSYYDVEQGARLQAPEYGGDGKMDAQGEFMPPLVAFPGHWGPNDMIFYGHDAFPQKYRNGVFIAFHGSWNRAPLPQGGYNVAFVPMKSGKPAGDWEIFADGFKGADILKSPRDAAARPMGLAVGRDGALFIADSLKGKIWKVTYVGK